VFISEETITITNTVVLRTPLTLSAKKNNSPSWAMIPREHGVVHESKNTTEPLCSGWRGSYHTYHGLTEPNTWRGHWIYVWFPNYTTQSVLWALPHHTHREPGGHGNPEIRSQNKSFLQLSVSAFFVTATQGDQPRVFSSDLHLAQNVSICMPERVNFTKHTFKNLT
jgi:hypothetical protein